MKKLDSILLVDDDKATNFIHNKILKDSGYVETVEITTSGYDALDYLQACLKQDTQLPELIFMDLNMPGMDGWECVEKIEKMLPEFSHNPKIVILTTSLNPDDEQKAGHLAPVFAFCRKPLNTDIIRDLIKRM